MKRIAQIFTPHQHEDRENDGHSCSAQRTQHASGIVQPILGGETTCTDSGRAGNRDFGAPCFPAVGSLAGAAASSLLNSTTASVALFNILAVGLRSDSILFLMFAV